MSRPKIHIFTAKDSLARLTSEDPDRILVSYGNGITARWITRCFRPPNQPFYQNAWHITLSHDTSYFLIRECNLTDRVGPDEFLDFVRTNYSDDFDWMLFHPEIFKGRIDLGD